MKSTRDLSSGLHSLVIFRNLLQDPVISRLLSLLDSDPASGSPFVDAYCEFAAALFSRTDDFSAYLLNAVLEDENFYVTGGRSRRSPLTAVSTAPPRGHFVSPRMAPRLRVPPGPPRFPHGRSRTAR